MINLIKENPSIVSKDLKIVGNLKSKGLIEIEGTITGDIEADSVSIRENGKVDGNVKASILNVKGVFNGKAVCEKINISDTANVDGNLEYNSLSVDYGASINCQLKRIENIKNSSKLLDIVKMADNKLQENNIKNN